MSRIKTFRAEIKVTEQYARLGSNPAGYVKEQLDAQLAEIGHGPRGGTYRLFGDIEYLGKAAINDDWMRALVTYSARRQGKYVRPRRERGRADREGVAG